MAEHNAAGLASESPVLGDAARLMVALSAAASWPGRLGTQLRTVVGFLQHKEETDEEACSSRWCRRFVQHRCAMAQSSQGQAAG
jgi:hypothetical protein